MKIYLVGGAVRDLMLNRPIEEKDWVVVGATAEEMLVQGFQAVGKDFPVFLHPQTREEYALARTERKTGRGYTQFQFHADPSVTLEEDLKRRDLTINAMAIPEEEWKKNEKDKNKLINKIIDPYNGKKDLQDKLLHHISPAFAEDPVRILRIARFTARFAELGFKIHPETSQLMRQMVRAGEVDALVPERVWQEFSTALIEPRPEQFFRVLRECGALAILFPEIDHLFGVPGEPHIHHEIDMGEHALLALSRTAKLNYSAAVRFAGLLQEIGKSHTDPKHWPKHPEQIAAGEKLAKQLCDRYRVPNDYRQLALLGIHYHTKVYNALQLVPADLLLLLEKTDAFRRPERFNQFLQACAVNYCQGFQEERLNFPQADYLLEVLDIANRVSINDLIEKEFTGDEIKKALQLKRITSIDLYLNTNKK